MRVTYQLKKHLITEALLSSEYVDSLRREDINDNMIRRIIDILIIMSARKHLSIEQIGRSKKLAVIMEDILKPFLPEFTMDLSDLNGMITFLASTEEIEPMTMKEVKRFCKKSLHAIEAALGKSLFQCLDEFTDNSEEAIAALRS